MRNVVYLSLFALTWLVLAVTSRAENKTVLTEGEVLEFVLKPHAGFEDEWPVISAGKRVIVISSDLDPKLLKGLGLSASKRHEMALARMIAAFLAGKPVSLLENLKAVFAENWSPSRQLSDANFEAARQALAAIRILEPKKIKIQQQEKYEERFQDLDPQSIQDEIKVINREIDPRGRTILDHDLSDLVPSQKKETPLITLPERTRPE